MLRDVRLFDAPELDAHHEQIEVRTPSLRVGVQRGRNVVSDYALVQRASPFLHHLQRAEITILLEGSGRFDEAGRHLHLVAGSIAVSDQARGGTEAYGGPACRWLTIEWDPALLGVAPGPVVVDRMPDRDRARFAQLADVLSAGGDPRTLAGAMADVLSLLRTFGVGFARVSAADLAHATAAEEQRLHSAVNAHLSQLRAFPAIDDVIDDIGWNARRVHRHVQSMARRYRLPWETWREALHYTRLLQAVRLLAAPGATTELVAKLTGFRAPTALCHAFADGGLPSPGVLARAARRDVLDVWSSFGETRPAVRRIRGAKSAA